MLIRLRFAKGDEVRFLSHLDMTKTFERAMRRAHIPIAFSEGFNPHPRFSFASALAVGTTSEGEYADFELKEAMDPEVFRKQLQEALPPGLTLLQTREIPPGGKALMSVVNRADYRVRGDLTGPMEGQELDELIEAFLQAKEILVERKGKKGPQIKNVREGVYSLSGRIDGDQWEITMSVITGGQGNLRPEDVIKGLLLVTGEGFPMGIEDLDVQRTGLGIGGLNGIQDPFGE